MLDAVWGSAYSRCVMNRREFISSAMGTVMAGSLAARGSAVSNRFNLGGSGVGEARPASQSGSLALDRHRFGVNYTPSKNWWFCWNEWDADSIRRDLDAI